MLPPLTRRPPDRTVVEWSRGLRPIIVGAGDIDFLCWRCGFTICEGMATAGDVSGRLFRCPDCGAMNRARL